MATIVVFVEHGSGSAKRASLECLGAAHATGAEVVAVVTGAGAADVAPTLGAFGAPRAVVLAGGDPYAAGAAASGVAAVVQAEGATACLAAATTEGKDILPRVAAHLDSVAFSDCTGFTASGDGFEVTRPWLAGKCIATLTSDAPVTCATTRLNVFTVVEAAGSVTGVAVGVSGGTTSTVVSARRSSAELGTASTSCEASRKATTAASTAITTRTGASWRMGRRYRVRAIPLRRLPVANHSTSAA